MFLSVESNCFMREMIIDNFQKVWNNSSGLFYLKKFLWSPIAEHGLPLACGCPFAKSFKMCFYQLKVIVLMRKCVSMLNNLQLALHGPNLPASLEACKLRQGPGTEEIF